MESMDALMESLMGFMIWATWISWLIGVAMYVFSALCLQIIARKTNTEHGWLAWIPFANFYLMCKIAGRPGWWLVFFFIPIANIVFMVIVWMGITEARNRNGWLGLLMLVPIANLVLPGYLAFSEGGTQAAKAESQANFIVSPHLSYATQLSGSGGVGVQPGRELAQQPGGWPSIDTGETMKPKRTEDRNFVPPSTGVKPNGNHVRLVLPLSADMEQVAQFNKHLKEINGLTIVMTGGSMAEGSLIIASVPEDLDLIPILNEMPAVEDSYPKGENIAVTLKTVSAS